MANEEHDREEAPGEDDIVVLTGEDGEDVAFQVLAIVKVEGQEYALLGEVDEETGELPEEIDVHVFRYAESDEGPEFDDDVDEATFEKVKLAFQKLMEEAGVGDES